jgi:hypothetical protein
MSTMPTTIDTSGPDAVPVAPPPPQKGTDFAGQTLQMDANREAKGMQTAGTPQAANTPSAFPGKAEMEEHWNGAVQAIKSAATPPPLPLATAPAAPVNPTFNPKTERVQQQMYDSILKGDIKNGTDNATVYYNRLRGTTGPNPNFWHPEAAREGLAIHQDNLDKGRNEVIDRLKANDAEYMSKLLGQKYSFSPDKAAAVRNIGQNGDEPSTQTTGTQKGLWKNEETGALVSRNEMLERAQRAMEGKHDKDLREAGGYVGLAHAANPEKYAQGQGGYKAKDKTADLPPKPLGNGIVWNYQTKQMENMAAEFKVGEFGEKYKDNGNLRTFSTKAADGTTTYKTIELKPNPVELKILDVQGPAGVKTKQAFYFDPRAKEENKLKPALPAVAEDYRKPQDVVDYGPDGKLHAYQIQPDGTQQPSKGMTPAQAAAIRKGEPTALKQTMPLIVNGQIVSLPGHADGSVVAKDQKEVVQIVNGQIMYLPTSLVTLEEAAKAWEKEAGAADPSQASTDATTAAKAAGMKPEEIAAAGTKAAQAARDANQAASDKAGGLRAEITRRQGHMGGGTAAATAPALPQPKTPEEAAKLAPGTPFLTPDGRKKVR